VDKAREAAEKSAEETESAGKEFSVNGQERIRPAKANTDKRTQSNDVHKEPDTYRPGDCIYGSYEFLNNTHFFMFPSMFVFLRQSQLSTAWSRAQAAR